MKYQKFLKLTNGSKKKTNLETIFKRIKSFIYSKVMNKTVTIKRREPTGRKQ